MGSMGHLWATSQHPHILALFDSGNGEGYLYYVMPFIDGETLREKLDRENQLGVEEAVRIARDLANALDYAHRNDVIHRAIKLGNILLHDGRPRGGRLRNRARGERSWRGAADGEGPHRRDALLHVTRTGHGGSRRGAAE